MTVVRHGVTRVVEAVHSVRAEVFIYLLLSS
jgi:hypothetical protein